MKLPASAAVAPALAAAGAPLEPSARAPRVMTAYNRQPFQIVGGPSWQNSNKFDITAKAEDGSASLDQMRIMLRELLEDRFRLKAHVETREVPIYTLVLARGDGRLGPKMKASTDTCPDFKEPQQKKLEAIAKGGVGALQSMVGKPGENKPCSMTNVPPTPANPVLGFRATGQSMELLVTLLTQLSGRPVIDKTGLTGPLDFELTISLQSLAIRSAGRARYSWSTVRSCQRPTRRDRRAGEDE